MAQDVWQADEETQKLMLEVKSQHHPGLAEANIDVVFKEAMPTRNGTTPLGKARRVSGVYKAMVSADFLIILNNEEWQKMDDEKRRAVLDHELCHCAPKYDDDGCLTGWTMQDHDFEEFEEIVERHGPYTRRAESMGRTVLRQKALFERDRACSPDEKQER